MTTEQHEAYRDYVVALAETEDGAGALVDFIFDLLCYPPTQAHAWLKEALAYPDEALAMTMGGLDYSDWLLDRGPAEAGKVIDERVREALEGRR